MEILGNNDTKTNQWVLTPKQLYLVEIMIKIYMDMAIENTMIFLNFGGLKADILRKPKWGGRGDNQTFIF